MRYIFDAKIFTRLCQPKIFGFTMIEYFRRILTDSRNTTKVGDIFYPFYVVLYDKKYIYHEDLQSIGVIIFLLDGEVFLCVPANIFLEEGAVFI